MVVSSVSGLKRSRRIWRGEGVSWYFIALISLYGNGNNKNKQIVILLKVICFV